MAGASAASRPRSPRPARLSRRGGSAAGGARCLGWAARYAELGARTILLFHSRDPALAPVLPPDAGVPYREPGVPAVRAGAAGLPDAWCWLQPRPGSGPRREGGGLSEVWGKEQGPAGARERGRRRRRRCRQRLTESAPRPAPGVGARDRRAGLGAGAREERLTVKSQAKAQKTQRPDHRLPRRRQLRGSTALVMWAHGPHPSALPTPSQACHPLPH